MAALGGARDGRQLCSVLCNLKAVCSASELSRAAPCRGQDLSLLPTSSPCAAAKPPLGKGLNFGFGRPLFPTLCHYAAQIEKTARGDSGGWRDVGGSREESVPSLFGFLLNTFLRLRCFITAFTVKNISLL